MTDILLSHRYVSIHNRDTLLVTDDQGWVGDRQTGLFSRDTRYLSSYRMSINGFEPRLLGATRPYFFAHVFDYTNPSIGAGPRLIEENSLLLQVSRYIYRGVHEDVEILNYAGKPVEITLTLSIGFDFVDIFQVRGFELLIPHIARTYWDGKRGTLSMDYRNGDFTRVLVYDFSDSESPPSHRLGAVSFVIKLARRADWHACFDIHFEDKPSPGHAKAHTINELVRDLRHWQGNGARIETAAVDVGRTYNQAVLDLGSLRLEDVGEHWFPAAGVPWYTAVFGRDALIAGLQTLTFNCHFPVGVLERLAQLQGKKVDLWTEEEPGKIPHELRQGELASTGKIPHTPYYGTIDASLLYVILLHELYRFTADLRLLERFYLPATSCLEWASRYGDFDGDGFVEYRPLSPKGYRNQAWKDAYDSVVYPDGSLVEPPIAICEVQGYYYDALRRMAEIAGLVGKDKESIDYARRAEDLFVRFNKTFWLDDEDRYAYCLDPQKQPVATVASNIGQLLWSRIAPPERAERVGLRLLERDMYSGWGIRTLSSANPAFDPVSYQRGTVWPHDNAIIALGMKSYGLWQEANRIAEGIFAIAARYQHYSLPELVAGMDRTLGSMPVPYIDANLPQAWAAGSVLMLLRAIFGLEPDPAHHRLIVAPALPEWLPDVRLRNLAIFGQEVDLHFAGRGPDTSVEVLRRTGDVEIEVRRESETGDAIRPKTRRTEDM